jgi:aryl-alcohol dehydrogenase-like predicted oxidoreductase
MSTTAASTTESINIGGDLTVGRIGYGAMQLTGEKVWGAYPDHDAGIALLRHVVDAGVTFIDTADVYGPHSNELLIREALHPYPDDLVIATKGGFVRGGPALETLDAVGNSNYLRQCVHMSLRRLGREHIDLYYLHSGYAKDSPFEDQVGVLAEIKQEGLIRHVGLSNVTVEQFDVARKIVDIAAITAQYNLASRVGASQLAAAEKANVVFSPWAPTRLGGPDAQRIRDEIQVIAERHGASPHQVALAWHLHRSPNSLPIPGTVTPEHVAQNIAAAGLALSPSEVHSLTELTPEDQTPPD